MEEKDPLQDTSPWNFRTLEEKRGFYRLPTKRGKKVKKDLISECISLLNIDDMLARIYEGMS